MPPEDQDLDGVEVENEKDTVVTLDDEDEGKETGANSKDADADEERLGADPEADADKEKEKQREARRQRRKTARQWIKRDRLELNFLRQQNEELESRLAQVEHGQKVVTTQTQASRIDGALAQLKSRLDEIDEVIEAAVNESDGARVVQANRQRDEIREHITKLSTARAGLKGNERQIEESATQGEVAREAQRTAMNNARIFKSRHDWYDGESEDSRIINRLDRELRDEGKAPNTAAFWVELEKRAAKEIPHRFKNRDEEDDDPDEEDDDEDERTEQRETRTDPNKGRQGAKGGPQITGVSGGKKSGTKGKTSFVISAARKDAMVKSGVWDDPVLRNKMIRRYMAYDKHHGLVK